MKRIVAVLVLVGFLVYTGTYVFIYLFRAFRLEAPADSAVVYVWHGDPMARAILVAVLFAIGLLLLLFLVIMRAGSARRGAVGLRPDLATWLTERSEATGETPGALADRAVASYRAAMEEGRPLRAP